MPLRFRLSFGTEVDGVQKCIPPKRNEASQTTESPERIGRFPQTVPVLLVESSNLEVQATEVKHPLLGTSSAS